jgi:hypothetical protein
VDDDGYEDAGDHELLDAFVARLHPRDELFLFELDVASVWLIRLAVAADVVDAGRYERLCAAAERALDRWWAAFERATS